MLRVTVPQKGEQCFLVVGKGRMSHYMLLESKQGQESALMEMENGTLLIVPAQERWGGYVLWR